MLTLRGSAHRLCDGLSRRDFFTVGALGIGGLTMADVLRARAESGTKTSHKAVIMVYLPGGPSHIDTFDMKPDAPAEVRGEFKPIKSKVSGVEMCELLPLHAEIADKFSTVNGLQCIDTHSADLLLRGHLGGPTRRPVFGSVVSRYTVRPTTAGCRDTSRSAARTAPTRRTPVTSARRTGPSSPVARRSAA